MGVATIVPSILFIELLLTICVVNSTATKYWPRDLKEMSCKQRYQSNPSEGLHIRHKWHVDHISICSILDNTIQHGLAVAMSFLNLNDAYGYLMHCLIHDILHHSVEPLLTPGHP